MVTTIQISDDLQTALTSRKLSSRETYEVVIWDLLEDAKEINEETKKELSIARAQIKKGDVYSLEQVKKEAGL